MGDNDVTETCARRAKLRLNQWGPRHWFKCSFFHVVHTSLSLHTVLLFATALRRERQSILTLFMLTIRVVFEV